MINGIYHYEQGNNPYDVGSLVISVKETEKSYVLKVIEEDMRYSTYVDVLFKGKKQVTINKAKSPHALNVFSYGFVIYPNRMGCPLCFVKEGAR